jgi:hypothetical protein
MWEYVSWKDYKKAWQNIDKKIQLPKSLSNKKSTPELTPERLFAFTPNPTPDPIPEDLFTPNTDPI